MLDVDRLVQTTLGLFRRNEVLDLIQQNESEEGSQQQEMRKKSGQGTPKTGTGGQKVIIVSPKRKNHEVSNKTGGKHSPVEKRMATQGDENRDMEIKETMNMTNDIQYTKTNWWR